MSITSNRNTEAEKRQEPDVAELVPIANTESIPTIPHDQEAERREALAASFAPPPGPVLPKDGTCFSLVQDELLQALTTVLKSVPTRRFYPAILFHILIQVEADHVRLCSTDLSTAIVREVRATVEQTGTFTINAKLLLDCVKTFPKDGRVTVEVKGGQVVVSCGKRTFSLKDATDAAEFPRLPDVGSADPCIIPADRLRQAIKEVGYAAATDDSRPVFLAICMHIQETSMNLVACDGKRMAIRTLVLPNVSGRNASVLVPASAFQLLCAIMPKDAEITIAWDKERAAFTCGSLRLVTRLIAGTYPNYRAALPESYKTTFTLSRCDLVSLLTAFRPFTRERSNLLKCCYAAESVVFQAKGVDLGEVREDLSAEIEGEDGYVFLDAEYLADVLKNVGASSFTFAVSGYDHPVLLTPVGRDDYQALIMPMSSDW